MNEMISTRKVDGLVAACGATNQRAFTVSLNTAHTRSDDLYVNRTRSNFIGVVCSKYVFGRHLAVFRGRHV